MTAQLSRTSDQPRKAPKAKARKCKVCRSAFVASRPMQVVCGPTCAYAHGIHKTEAAKAAAMKAERKKLKEQREKLKSRSQWAREAQSAVNAYVRERDKDLPCISCGRFHQGSYDAGHYRSVGAVPALRFDLANIHRQCVPCNQHKSGNVLEYRLGLLARLGPLEVARLEGKHEPKKYTIEDLRRIRDEYRAKLRELKGMA